MSLLSLGFRLLSVGPQITFRPHSIIIRNARLLRIITLFLYLRRTEIDIPARAVTMEKTVFYFSRRRRLISFSDLRHLKYSYTSAGTSWGLVPGGFGRQDEMEMFTISLVTKDFQTFPLCTFAGEGAVNTGWFGCLVGGDSLTDWYGTQEMDSRRFVEVLAKVLQIRVD